MSDPPADPNVKDITLGETAMIETFEYIKIRLTAMAKTERGASAVEYGLLVAGIAALIVAIVFVFGGVIKDAFKGTCETVKGSGTATSGSCG
jgi:pilus assembly protein Flp/PilA